MLSVPEAETVADGGVFTVTTVEEDVAEQALALATVTVYEPAALAV
jgi:hypothetical protein